jgi:hypothetical protein
MEHASPLQGETLYVCGALTGGLRPRPMSVVPSGLGAHPDGVDVTFWIACVIVALEGSTHTMNLSAMAGLEPGPGWNRVC